MVRARFLWIAVVLIACGPSAEQDGTKRNNQQETSISNPEAAFENKYEKVFVYEDRQTRYLLGVNDKTATEIEFMMGYYRKDGSCADVFKGIAVNYNAGNDPEIDEDEHGDAYASEEFIYEKEGCMISIRIAKDSRDKAVIFSNGCRTTCAHEETGVLHLQE